VLVEEEEDERDMKKEDGLHVQYSIEYAAAGGHRAAKAVAKLE